LIGKENRKPKRNRDDSPESEKHMTEAMAAKRHKHTEEDSPGRAWTDDNKSQRINDWLDRHLPQEFHDANSMEFWRDLTPAEIKEASREFSKKQRQENVFAELEYRIERAMAKKTSRYPMNVPTEEMNIGDWRWLLPRTKPNTEEQRRALREGVECFFDTKIRGQQTEFYVKYTNGQRSGGQYPGPNAYIRSGNAYLSPSGWAGGVYGFRIVSKWQIDPRLVNHDEGFTGIFGMYQVSAGDTEGAEEEEDEASGKMLTDERSREDANKSQNEDGFHATKA
ncbi:MAG: hypothetical protein Q9181_005423, partial [Wetmoreana brouardii]